MLFDSGAIAMPGREERKKEKEQREVKDQIKEKKKAAELALIFEDTLHAEQLLKEADELKLEKEKKKVQKEELEKEMDELKYKQREDKWGKAMNPGDLSDLPQAIQATLAYLSTVEKRRADPSTVEKEYDNLSMMD